MAPEILDLLPKQKLSNERKICKNLQEFIELLRREGELKEIHVEVDPILEVTEIYDRVVKQGGPALLFHNVKGSSMPLLINAFGSQKRTSLALGVGHPNEIANRISSLMEGKSPDSFFEKLKFLPKLKEISNIAPKLVSKAPCQEVVLTDGPMLDLLPVIQCWPKDAGKFITLPIVVTKNPETKIRNVGLYRMQIYDNRSTGMHWQVHKDGAEHFRRERAGGRKRMEVAVAIGADPVTVYSASAPLPYGADEYLLSGFIRNKPLELVKCKTVDLEVPAESEIILEGYVDLEETRPEGPFGDHTGFYTPRTDFPVFHVEMMTLRRNPAYLTTAVGRPPMEDCFMGNATERIFLPLLQKQLPEVTNIHMPFEGVFHNCLLVSIRKSFPHHARKVMNAVWGLGQMMFAKCVIIFDEDTNVEDVSEAAWKAFNNVDPKRDIVFTEGPVDQLDHSASQALFGSKMGIDATRKMPEEGMQRPWPEEMAMSPDIANRVTERWREYGF